MWRGDIGVGEPIESAGSADEDPVLDEPCERLWMYACVAQFATTHDAMLLEQLDRLIALGFMADASHVT